MPRNKYLVQEGVEFRQNRTDDRDVLADVCLVKITGDYCTSTNGFAGYVEQQVTGDNNGARHLCVRFWLDESHAIKAQPFIPHILGSQEFHT